MIPRFNISEFKARLPPSIPLPPGKKREMQAEFFTCELEILLPDRAWRFLWDNRLGIESLEEEIREGFDFTTFKVKEVIVPTTTVVVTVSLAWVRENAPNLQGKLRDTDVEWVDDVPEFLPHPMLCQKLAALLEQFLPFLVTLERS